MGWDGWLVVAEAAIGVALAAWAIRPVSWSANETPADRASVRPGRLGRALRALAGRDTPTSPADGPVVERTDTHVGRAAANGASTDKAAG